MPVVVKEEIMDDENDDLKLLGVTPAPRVPLQALSIKDGKVVWPEHSGASEPKRTSEKEEKSAEKSEEKIPDVGDKGGEVPEAGKIHPTDDTPEKQPQETQSDSETEVDVIGSQTPRKHARKRPADSDNKTEKCESDEETKSDPKRRKAAAAPTAMSLRNRDRPAKFITGQRLFFFCCLRTGVVYCDKKLFMYTQLLMSCKACIKPRLRLHFTCVPVIYFM